MSSSSSFAWPDPRAKWPETAKKNLKQILIRGRPKTIIKEEPGVIKTASQQQQQDPLSGVGLSMGSSDYNFSTNTTTTSSSSKPTTSSSRTSSQQQQQPIASVASFLTHVANTIISSSTNNDHNTSSSSFNYQQDECALMFIADLLEVACGPGGVAHVKVNFPSNDPGGAQFYKQFAAANGARVENVTSFLRGGGMNQSTAAALTQMNNAAAGGSQQTSSSSKSGGNAGGQMAVSCSICLVSGNDNNTNNTNNSTSARGNHNNNSNSNNNVIANIVVDRCGPEGQHQAIHFRNQHQNLMNTSNTAGSTAAQRRGRQSTLSSTTSHQDASSAIDIAKNPTSVLFGYFATTLACSTCPWDSLKALLCRRPTLHQLPCSVLLVVFASLQQILDQYDILRGQPPKNNNSGNNGMPRVKQQQPLTISSLLPIGLPFAMTMFDGEDQSSKSSFGRSSWEWLWKRIGLMNRMLNEGNETFAKVV